jgi:dihydropteroate synthase
VKTSFEQVLENLKSRGIEEERVVFDPGIGFGKRLQDNLTLMAQLESLRVAGRPILMGLSRKSFMGELVGERAQEPARRDAVTAALTAYTAIKGASIHRVHEVKMNREALAMINEVRSYSY